MELGARPALSAAGRRAMQGYASLRCYAPLPVAAPLLSLAQYITRQSYLRHSLLEFEKTDSKKLPTAFKMYNVFPSSTIQTIQFQISIIEYRNSRKMFMLT